MRPAVCVGRMPSSVPPSSGSSSTISSWPSTVTVCDSPERRRATAGSLAAALEQRRVVDVGEARHRVDEVGGAVEVGEDGADAS